jgi:YVTN family beta-propeller protein
LHTATLLNDGRILIAGGNANSSQIPEAFLSSAELYDPTSGSFSPVGSLAFARYYHTATLLENGKVLIAGGENMLAGSVPNGLASAELYDPATGKLDWSMGTGQDRTHMIYVSSDGKKIYTTNVSSGTVSILVDTLIQPGKLAPPNARPRQDWIQTVIPTARGSEGFDVSRDGSELWTAASEDGTISIIDLGAKKLAAKIDAKVLGANRLKFTPDGKLVFISSLQSGELTIYDAKSRKEIKRLKIGHGAAGILMDPDGSRAFVACSADNYIAVIDLKTLEVTSHLDVGGVPDGLAWAIRP